MRKNEHSPKKLFGFFKSLFKVNDYVFDEFFDLEKPDSNKNHEQQKKDESKQKKSKQPQRGYSVAQLKKKKHQEKCQGNIIPKKIDVSRSLSDNIDTLKTIFHLPQNKDVVIREFSIPLNGLTAAAIIYIDGAANTTLIDGFVLQPLMVLSNLNNKVEEKPLEVIKNLLVPVNQIAEARNLQDIIDGVLNGDTAILINGADKALVVETKGWPVRSISDPKTEKVTQGPSDAFNESFRQNLALIRKRLRTEDLITEYFKVGWRSNTDLALVYLDGIVNPKIVVEMRKRLESIKVSYVTDTGLIQQLVGDNPYSFFPTTLATERPDRVTAFLNEGHIAIIMDGSPFVIIAPITIWGLLHSPEDYYLSPVIGSFIRIIRTISFFIGVITPSFYIAITNFHPEMIPTDLLLAIAASRELVPFPVIMEVILMEFSFELIREAGTRIPSILGSTIGIVGALILGQAAVQANIVSPILVIIVAITALGSFTVPNVAFSFTVRLLRFIFIFMAAVLGFFGIAAGLMILTIRVTGLKSLGIPMLSPIAPFRPESGDIVLRRPFFAFDSMPNYMKPKTTKLQTKLVRKWDPVSRNKVKGGS